jgi:hydrogenase maturation protease
MKRPLVIGYGNPLRSDDRLGWAVAEHLAHSLAPESADVMTAHQLMPEHAEPVSAAGVVYFVDASHRGEPGSWRCEKIESGSASGHAIGHQFAPAGLLDYVRAVYGESPEACLVSVAGGSFECAETLTPAVEAAVAGVACFLSEKIDEYNRREFPHA